MFPQTDFNITLFNVHPDEIKSLEAFKQESTFHYHFRLKLKKLTCPYCGESTISHGQKERIIHHPNLIDFDGIIHYYSRRYLCKDCQKTFSTPILFLFLGLIIVMPLWIE